MTNPYYTPSGTPQTGSQGSSAAIRAELASIAAGFDLLPPLTANKAVVVNAGGTALGVTTGSLALAGDFATTGTYSTSFTQSANVTLALPGANGTLATLAGVEAFTNKTSYNKVVITAPATGSTLTIADGKTLTISNTLTFTGTDDSSVDFGGGGTVLYSGGSYVSSLSGTTNEIDVSAGTGDITLSLSSSLVAPGTLEVTGNAAFQSKLGVGMSPANILDITQNQNATSRIALLNNDAGASAVAALKLDNGNTNGTLTFNMTGTGSTDGTVGASGASILANVLGSFAIGTTTSRVLKFLMNSTAVAQVGTDGSLNVGGSANAGFGQIAFGGGSFQGLLTSQGPTTIANGATGTVYTCAGGFGSIAVVNISSSGGYQRTDLIIALNGAVTLLGTAGAVSAGSISWSNNGTQQRLTNNTGADITASSWSIGSLN